MITRVDFAAIDVEVQKALEDTLENLKNINPEGYVLFLADAEYNSEYDIPAIPYSPYVIDSRLDWYKDETRLSFLSQFMSNYYSFPPAILVNDDNQYRIQIELMIYSHIWESKPFLKKLHRLAHLSNNEPYNWKVQVPPMSKHDFIRLDIRQAFSNHGNPMADVMKKSFHTSLRNAFAHSEYSFDTMNGNTRIVLYNNSGAAWELQEISFNDWTKRFIYSAFLSYHFVTKSHTRRQNLIANFGKDTFQIKHPIDDNTFKNVNIKYIKEQNGFSFVS